ncbi:hypothetical protein PO878_06345 [Iamia majanohamensis]|uniref:Uncharacterized protein n=1 Tax=Iamia majanohamensis TaxID=467976 RepID=A0AAF0BV01_9ACTN|nr:hypothetical protein [Iamia majanohamensis]WCO68347.1 hypothetical protein PO878_06345 [Iamia majanohamensis]
MASDKDAAKRRRQARNRQERTKRQTRVEAAGRPSSRPARTADGVAATTGRRAPAKGTKATTGDGASAPANPIGSGSLLGKLFPPRPQGEATKGAGGRPSRAQPTQSVVVDVGEAEGVRGWLHQRMSQPGGRPALLALFVAVVSAVTLLAFPVLPRFAFEYYGETVVQASGEAAGESQAQVDAMVDTFADGDTISAGTSRLSDVAPLPYTLVFSLIPVIICALAVSSLTKPTRSRTLLISALAAAMYVFFSQGIGTFFILGVLALGFGAYKSRKADAAGAAVAAGTAED